MQFSRNGSTVEIQFVLNSSLFHVVDRLTLAQKLALEAIAGSFDLKLYLIVPLPPWVPLEAVLKSNVHRFSARIVLETMLRLKIRCVKNFKENLRNKEKMKGENNHV